MPPPSPSERPKHRPPKNPLSPGDSGPETQVQAWKDASHPLEEGIETGGNPDFKNKSLTNLTWPQGWSHPAYKHTCV